MSTALLILSVLILPIDRLSPVDEVKQADAALNQYILSGDVAAAELMYADQFILTTSSGKIKRKAEIVREIGSEFLQMQVNETTQVEVVIDGTTAILTGLLHQKGVIKGKPFDHFLLVTDTWIRTRKGWKILAGQANVFSKPDENGNEERQ
jgi:ketosteroid isomerase-like protein